MWFYLDKKLFHTNVGARVGRAEYPASSLPAISGGLTKSFSFWHVWDMPTGTEHVRLVGQSGSVRPTAETALLTRSGSDRQFYRCTTVEPA